MRILLVEDDPMIVSTLTDYLALEGFEVRSAGGEAAARRLMDLSRPDLLLVDLSLADGSGFGVFQAASRLGLPVIFLTASAEEATVVQALDMGAEDYIAKPFRPRELISRIRSVLRRSGKAQTRPSVGRLRVDPETASVTMEDRELSLSALEYRLLLRLMSRKNGLLTRDELLQELWDAGGDYVNDNTLSVYIKRLRDKIGAGPGDPEYIQTLRGRGYSLGGADETVL